MVRHWQQLGFVTRVDLPGGAAPVYVEVERTLPPRQVLETVPNSFVVTSGPAAGSVAGRGVGGVGTSGVYGGASAGGATSGAKRARMEMEAN